MKVRFCEKRLSLDAGLRERMELLEIVFVLFLKRVSILKASDLLGSWRLMFPVVCPDDVGLPPRQRLRKRLLFAFLRWLLLG